MKKLFQIVRTDNGKPVGSGGTTTLGEIKMGAHVDYYDKKEGKGGAKEARFELNRGKKGTQFETEADYWDADGNLIKPYPYSIKRGPDNYRGAGK